MATSKEYLNFILDQLSELDVISHQRMMGEYIIYHHGKIAAYLCDVSEAAGTEKEKISKRQAV